MCPINSGLEMGWDYIGIIILLQRKNWLFGTAGCIYKCGFLNFPLINWFMQLWSYSQSHKIIKYHFVLGYFLTNFIYINPICKNTILQIMKRKQARFALMLMQLHSIINRHSSYWNNRQNKIIILQFSRCTKDLTTSIYIFF